MKFEPSLFHPNTEPLVIFLVFYSGIFGFGDGKLNVWVSPVYPDGNVCISILHTGDDKTGYEQASERWSPVQSVEKVILSVISMLSGTSGPI